MDNFATKGLGNCEICARPTPEKEFCSKCETWVENYADALALC